MMTGDADGRAAYACGRGLAVQVRPVDVPLTAREALRALDEGAQAVAELQISESGGPAWVFLSPTDVRAVLNAMDGDETTRFFLTSDVHLRLRVC